MTTIEQETDTTRKPTVSRTPFNIVLVGMTGCGKSTIGWLLAQKTNYGFLDLDAWVEKRAGKPISEIFATDGEATFRDLEKKAISTLAGIRNHVIALGSGAVMDDASWNFCKSLGTTVWIDCQLVELIRRLRNDKLALQNRPLLNDIVKEADPVLTAMLGQRKSRFAEADISLSENFSTADESARKIRGLVSRRRETLFRQSDSPRTQRGVS